MSKDRFVIIDAVGVCESEELNDTRPLEQKPLISFMKLLKMIQFGKPNKDNLSSMASRLSRLHKKLTEKQIDEIKKLTDGKDLTDFALSFVEAIDEDKIFLEAKKEFGKGDYVEYVPKKKELEEVSQKRMISVIQPFIGNAEFIRRLPEIKQETEQIIDEISLDVVEEAAYSPIAKEKAKNIIKSFKDFIKENKDELTAIQVFYDKNHLHWDDLKELADKIKSPPYILTTSKLWQAYKQLEDGKIHGRTNNERIVDFVSLLRHEIEKTKEIEPWLDTVDKRFSQWLSKQKAKGVSFTQEQLIWLEALKNTIATSIEITADDFDYTPFDKMGGLGKASQVFGSKFDSILKELNVELSV